MPKQPVEVEKSEKMGPSANDSLIPILAGLLPGMATLLTIPSQAPATGKVIFAIQLVVGFTVLCYGLLLQHRGVSSRAFFLSGFFALGLAVPAFFQIPVPSSTKSDDRQSAVSQVASATISSGSDKYRKSPVLSGFVYLNFAKVDPRYASRLVLALHSKKWQVTDDPARSAVMLDVSVDVAVSPGLAVGGTATWQATGSATLRAVGKNSDRPAFEDVGHGHAVAMQSEHAAENAAAEALSQAVDDFDAAARREGTQP